MPRVGSEQYEALEHASATSTGTSDPKTLQPTNKRANGIWITVEGSFAARVTFDGTTPGVGAPPGLLIPTGTPPLLFPLASSAGGSGPRVRFSSSGGGNSTLAGMFVV